MFEATLIRKGAPLLNSLEAKGYELEVVHDCDRAEELIREIGRLDFTPMMNPSRLDFELGEAFWQVLKKDGRSVASCSARIIDLTSETLAGYTRRTSRRQYNRPTDPILELDPLFEMIRGKVVYTGQIQTEQKSCGNRNLNITDLAKFIKLMQLFILSKWDFNWLFGFIAERDLPLNRYYGFSMAMREAISWTQPAPKGREDSHVLLASPRRQVELFCLSEANRLGEN